MPFNARIHSLELYREFRTFPVSPNSLSKEKPCFVDFKFHQNVGPWVSLPILVNITLIVKTIWIRIDYLSKAGSQCFSYLIRIDHFPKDGRNELLSTIFLLWEDWEILLGGKFSKDNAFVASMNPCTHTKKTTSDKIILVGYCHLKVWVRIYKTIVWPREMVINVFCCKLLRKYKSALLFWILFIGNIFWTGNLIWWPTEF